MSTLRVDGKLDGVNSMLCDANQKPTNSNSVYSCILTFGQSIGLAVSVLSSTMLLTDTQPRAAGSGGIFPQPRGNQCHYYFDSGMFYTFSVVLSNFSNSFAEKPASLQKDPPKW